MSVAETSLQAFTDEKNKKHRETDKERVLPIIKEEAPITRGKVAERMGKYPHQISGRFTQLLKEEEIEVAGTTENTKGNTLEQLQPKKEKKVIFE